MKLRCCMCNKELDIKNHYLYGDHRLCSHRCYYAYGQQMILDLEDDSQQYIDIVKGNPPK